MHELGLRILIRRIQLVAASREIPLFPVYSYSALHYSRVFLKRGSGKPEVNGILRKHQMVSYCSDCLSLAVFDDWRCGSCKSRKLTVTGPMWTSEIFDPELAELIRKKYKGPGEKFVNMVAEESRINSLGFYDVHAMCRKFRQNSPKLESVISKLEKSGYVASRTHFSPNGIRTNARAILQSQKQ